MWVCVCVFLHGIIRRTSLWHTHIQIACEISPSRISSINHENGKEQSDRRKRWAGNDNGIVPAACRLCPQSAPHRRCECTCSMDRVYSIKLFHVLGLIWKTLRVLYKRKLPTQITKIMHLSSCQSQQRPKQERNPLKPQNRKSAQKHPPYFILYKVVHFKARCCVRRAYVQVEAGSWSDSLCRRRRLDYRICISESLVDVGLWLLYTFDGAQS